MLSLLIVKQVYGALAPKRMQLIRLVSMRFRRAIQLLHADKILCVFFLTGCMSTDRTPKDAVEVDSLAFSTGNVPAHVNPSIV